MDCLNSSPDKFQQKSFYSKKLLLLIKAVTSCSIHKIDLRQMSMNFNMLPSSTHVNCVIRISFNPDTVDTMMEAVIV